MAGKLKSQTAATETKYGVLDTAHQIWLAGMGAFVRTTQEGGKLFASLVEEGQKVQAHSREAAGSAVSGAVSGVVGKAGENWDRVEKIFEDRVSRVLGRLGVPTNDDIAALSKRVEQLTEAVSKLDSQAAPAKPAATKPAAVKKSAASGTAGKS